MANQTFQGYAQRRGFQQRDPGYQALEKMQQRDDQVIRGLEDQLRSIEQRSQQAETDLRNKLNREEQNRKDIFIEDDVYNIRKQALDLNTSTLRRNKDAAKQRNEQKTAELEKYAKFSETLATSLVQKRKKDIAATVDAAYLHYMANGTPLPDRLKYQASEELLEAQGDQIETQAEIAALNGAFPKSVSHIRSFNQAWDYAHLKATAVTAGETFGMDAQKYLADNQISGTIETKIALNKFQIDYLKKKGLYGLPSDFLTPMFDEVRKSRHAIIYNAQKLEVAEENKVVLRKAENAFFNATDIEKKKVALAKLFRLKSNIYENGETPNGNAASLDYIIDTILGDPAKVTDDELEELLDVRTVDKDGTLNLSYRDRFQSRIIKMRRERSKKIVTDYNTKLQIDRVEGNKKVDEVIKWIEDGNWNKDKKVITKLKSQLKQAGVPSDIVDRLNVYDAQSFQNQRADWWRQDLAEKRDNGTLSSADYIPGTTPYEVWQEFDEDAKEQDKLNGIIGYDEKSLGEEFDGFLLTSLNVSKVDAAGNASYASARAYAIQRYNVLRKSNQSDRVNTDPRKAAEDARIQVIDEIQNRKGKFQVLQGSDLVDAEGKSTLKRGDLLYNETIFPAFVPGSHVGGLKYTPSDSLNEANNIAFEQKKDSRYILENQFIETEVLIREADSISKNTGLLIPRIVYQLVQADPSLGSPLDIMKNQFKLAGIDVNIGDDFRLQWASSTTGEDPKAIKLIQSIRGIEDAAVAYEVVFNNGSSNVNYMDPKVKRAVVPKEIRQSNTPHPALTSLKNASDGRLEDNFIFTPSDDGKHTLEVLDLETMHYLIDNMDDTGWVYNLDTGLLDYIVE